MKESTVEVGRRLDVEGAVESFGVAGSRVIEGLGDVEGRRGG
jgi:hypothetical protein